MDKLTEMIRFRVTEEDKASFESLAEAEGMPLALWIRCKLKTVRAGPTYVLAPNYEVVYVGDAMKITKKEVKK